MDNFVRAGPLLKSHSMLFKWFEEKEYDNVVAQFWIEHDRLRNMFANIINLEVLKEGAMFHCEQDTEKERDYRMEYQSYEGCLHA